MGTGFIIVAYVLVCSSHDCDVLHNDDILRVPGPHNEVNCLMNAAEYAAGLDYPLKPGQSFRFTCGRAKPNTERAG